MFIEDDHGNIVNTRYIRMVSQNDSGGNYTVRIASHPNRDGDRTTTIDQTTFDKLLNNHAIIPNTQPLTLISIWTYDDEEPLIEKSPIIAWRIPPDGAYPIPIAIGQDTDPATTSLPHVDRHFIELPNGELQTANYEGSRYNSIDACINAVKHDETRRSIAREEQGLRRETST
jgi:hypothetical protein